MLNDYHVHTPYCGHARGNTVDYVKQAIRMHLTQLGFADHLGRYYLSAQQRKRFWDWGMDRAKLDQYMAELDGLRSRFAGSIDIRIGLEVDFVEGAEDLLASLLRACPIDFMLGSIHCLPRIGWHHVARYANTRPEAVYREYLRCARLAAASGIFDSLAHTDFIWRHIPWPRGMDDEIFAGIADIVAAAGASGTSVEMNVNGFLWSTVAPADSVSPFEVLVAQVARRDVPVTLGSDAHTPEAVGTSLAELTLYLRSRGVKGLATYRARRRHVEQLGLGRTDAAADKDKRVS